MKPLNVLSVKVVQAEQLREEIRQLLESLQETQTGSLASGYWVPLVDLCDANDMVTVRAELPGVRPEQVSITFADGLLKISGEKREVEAAHKPICYLCLERNYGVFSRALRVPCPVDVTRATAKLSDGVLLIKLPKLDERRQREVIIKVTEE